MACCRRCWQPCAAGDYLVVFKAGVTAAVMRAVVAKLAPPTYYYAMALKGFAGRRESCVQVAPEMNSNAAWHALAQPANYL